MTDSDSTATTPTDASLQTIVPAGVVDARITTISPEAADELRRQVEAGSAGGNRFVWFLTGFVAALVAGVIASVAFLAVSDADDDGDLDVPAVEFDVEG